MKNILREPLVRFTDLQGHTERGSLPVIYQAMMEGRVLSFPGLRSYQEHPWHSFLAQLGATAIERSGTGAIPRDQAEWAAALAALTPGYEDEAPWHLIQPDITRPAFMQPPGSTEESAEDYDTSREKEYSTPDAMDILINAKNHENKQAVAKNAQEDDWIFALITCQTMNGYTGGRLHGISRMNKGYSNRPGMGLAPAGTSPGGHLRRDMEALLQLRHQIMREHPYYQERNGIVLLWLEPWDGENKESLEPDVLDPLYIEVCRRIRLMASPQGEMRAVRATSGSTRINNVDRKGRTGDPWVPTSVNRDNLPMKLNTGGFNYRNMSRLLSAEIWKPAPLMLRTQQEEESRIPMELVARGMVRGKGETEGYYHRRIPLPPGTPLHILGEIARERIEQIALVDRILRHALNACLNSKGSADASKEQTRIAQQASRNLDEQMDLYFFDHAAQEAIAQVETAERREKCLPKSEPEDQAGDEAENRQKILREEWLQAEPIAHARKLLLASSQRLPCTQTQKYRARYLATTLFESRIAREFPREKKQQEAEMTTEEIEKGDEAVLNREQEKHEPAAAETGSAQTAEPGKTKPAAEGQRPNVPEGPWTDIVVRIARQLADPWFSKADLGYLQRMNTQGPYPPAMIKLLARYDLLDQVSPGSIWEEKWAVVINGLAVMTPRNLEYPPEGKYLPTAHNPTRAVGAVLAGSGADRPFYSESRMARLSSASGPAMRRIITTLARTMGKNSPCNWRQLAELVFQDGHDNQMADMARERILRAYYRTDQHRQWASWQDENKGDEAQPEN